MSTVTDDATSGLSNAQAVVASADLLGPYAVRAAVSLRIADHVDDGARTVDLLARRIGCDAHLLSLLISFLVERGLFATVDEPAGGSSIRVTPAGAPLRSGDPYSVVHLLDSASACGRAELGLCGLEEAVRTGRPSYPAGDYWNDVNRDQAGLASLSAGPPVPTHFPYDGELVLTGYDWSGVDHVTDVGGGNGAMLTALLTRWPHLRGTVVDLPLSVRAATDRFTAAGISDRADAVRGNFFEPLPGGSDVYLLSGILADWADEDALRILRRCREVVAHRGRVLLADVDMETSPSSPGTSFLALYIAALIPVPARTARRRRALIEAAGLRISWEGTATAHRTLVELVAA